MIQITQTKFSKISNLIFLTFCAFVISFVWLNKYISNIKLSTISSIIIALFFFVTYIVFKYFQNKIYTQNNNQKISIEELKNHLQFSNNSIIIEQLKTCFNFSNIIKIDNNHYIDSETNYDIYLMFEKETLSNEDYIHIYKNRINDNLKIFCINNTNKFPELENTTLETFDLLEINKILTSQNIKTNNYAKLKNKPKLRLKDIFLVSLNRSLSRKYFLFGLLILFSSLFTPYHIYYTIIGTILLLLSLYSHFNKRFNF